MSLDQQQEQQPTKTDWERVAPHFENTLVLFSSLPLSKRSNDPEHQINIELAWFAKSAWNHA